MNVYTSHNKKRNKMSEDTNVITKSFGDVIEDFSRKSNGAMANGGKLVCSAEEALRSIGSDEGSQKLKEVVRMNIIKAVQSTDLAGIRIVSLYDQIGQLVNSMTVFRNICKKNGTVRSTDFQVKWNEEYAGAGNVGFFNLNANVNPSDDQMNRGVRTNTHGAYGWTLNLPFIVTELAGQSPVMPQDIKLREVRMGLARMERFANRAMLSNTEVTAELNATPQWGGFINRSTAYNTTLPAGSDLTSPLIQNKVDAIANAPSNNGLGYQRPTIALTTSAQIAKIRDIMIARFGGENSQSYMATQADLEAAGISGAFVPALARVFQPDPGLPVIFVYESDLPTGGYCVFFDPTQVAISEFQMFGVPGPFVVERFTSTLNRLYVVFNMESLLDQLVPSRALYLGLN